MFSNNNEIPYFIIVGEHAGTVKKIGMKSTRVELLQGEELVLSNKELTTASVRNFKKMNKTIIKRMLMTFLITISLMFSTSAIAIKNLPTTTNIDETDLDPLVEEGLTDSKLMPKIKREVMYDIILKLAIDYQIVIIDAFEIDEMRQNFTNLNRIEINAIIKIFLIFSPNV